jgi:hypothetical protein
MCDRPLLISGRCTKEIENMKRQTIYCLLALAGLSLSPLAYSSPGARVDDASRTQGGQSQSVKSEDATPPSGVGLTKVGPGTLALNYVVRRDDGETKVEAQVERGALKKVTATDAAGMRTLKSVKPGGRLAEPCGAAGQAVRSLTLEDGQVVKIGVCKRRLVALLLPAVQKVREAAARSQSASSTTGATNRVSGGASCTAEKPCCFEDEKLGMHVCWHP